MVTSSQPSSQGGDMDTRFAHLLQPIRDLAKNWDVDIASHLEEYLDEIGSIAITFDGGTTTMNFAEAALLIQGSACVYSRKVEYLYALVYQVLDLLASKKKQKASSVDKDGNDADAPVDDDDKDEEFLSLDDIKEHKNIDLKCDEDDNAKSVAAMPRTPLALIPLEDGEKGEHPLLSRTGEVLGSRRDFKMNTCNVHLTGTMLLDMSHLSLLEASMTHKPSSTPFIPRTALGLPACSQEGSLPGMDVPEMQIDEGLHNGSLDDNDGGLLDDLPDMEEDPLPNNQEDAQDEVREEMGLRRAAQKKVVAPAKPSVDVWVPLDPHLVKAAPEKPFKKGRPVRIPPSLKTDATKKRKRTKVTENTGLQPIAEFCANAYHSSNSKFPSNQLKVPEFPEFEHLYWLEFRRRQAKFRRERKMLMDQGRLVELAEEEQRLEEENGHAADEPAVGGVEDDFDDGVPGFEGDDAPPLDAQQMSLLMQDQTPLAGAPSPGAAQAEESHIVSSYEQLVRQYVDGYLASAQQYAQITDLSRRVSEWEEKIKPTLEEEERHEPFDIHIYGSKVLDTFPEEDVDLTSPDPIPFRKVAVNKPPFEVCRLFLATLQLANNYNVEISNGGSLTVDTMEIKLLSKRRQFEELLEYRAPSIE